MDIQKQFNAVLAYSQKEPSPQTDTLFQLWKQNKKPFIDMLGDSYIYEDSEPVRYKLTEEEKATRINSFLDFVFELNEEIADFLDFERDGLFDNKVVHEFCVDEDVVIPIGMKIGKAIARYFNDCDRGIIKKIQNELARVIQENEVCGTMCISVHPLDYLSLSENNCNWRSCHALDGDYRTGNLNYMADSCTIVAYLKSEEKARLPRFPSSVPWNNKKWRMLLFFDKDRRVIYAGRQYPFTSEYASQHVLEILYHKFNFFEPADRRTCPALYWIKDRTIKKCNSYPLETPHFIDNGEIVPAYKVICNGENTFHYNDLLYSSCYLPYFVAYGANFICDNIFNHQNKTPLTIGHAVPCIRCGEADIEFGEAMFCHDCLPYGNPDSNRLVTCYKCGMIIFGGTSHISHGEYYCEQCYNDNPELEYTL